MALEDLTIKELINGGRTDKEVYELVKEAFEKEAEKQRKAAEARKAAEQKKMKLDELRSEMICSLLNYLEALTGLKIDEKDSEELEKYVKESLENESTLGYFDLLNSFLTSVDGTSSKSNKVTKSVTESNIDEILKALLK